MRDDGDRVEGGKSCRNQHLGTIGKESLSEARSRVEDGRRLSWVDAEPLGDVLGDRSCGDDGYGVVGGADVDEAGECSNAEFSTTLTMNVAGECLDDEADASVVADDFEHAASKDGDDNQFRHAHHTLVHG